jgi:V/A-type H+-transporting ATPase subunit I
MIVPMKKIVVVLQAKDGEAATKKLRAFGAVHVEEQREPKSKGISRLTEDHALVAQATEVLGKAVCAAGCRLIPPRKDFPDWRLTCHHILDTWKRWDQMEEYCRGLMYKMAEWEAWGDFDPEHIRRFAERGIFVKFIQLPVKQKKDLPPEAAVEEIFVKNNMAHCAVVSDKPLDIKFKEMELPRLGLSQMQKRLDENRKVIAQLKDEMGSFLGHLPQFSGVKAELEKELHLARVIDGMGQAGALAYLVGFIPHDREADLRKLASGGRWGLAVSDPSPEESVPTFVRNNRLVSIIAPVFRLIEVVPGYKELDISLPFLIFLSIFFGMLIGDAGYGVVYFALTAFVQAKWKDKCKDKAPFFLFYCLSLCAIAWGLLTGVFFCEAWRVGMGWKPLVPALKDPQSIQAFCFFLGALHLSIAHLWKAALKLPSWDALAEGGWVCVLWTAFFLARTLILSDPFPFFAKYLLWAGLFLVILFTRPQKNVFKAIGSGLGVVALNLMNNFTDVVSYVRLFAVGLAGVAIADTFNSMAAGVGRGGIFNLLLALIILFVGHALNLLLGPMSVLVHGVRLNVLEFCGHVGINWSGRAYKPFKED